MLAHLEELVTAFSRRQKLVQKRDIRVECGNSRLFVHTGAHVRLIDQQTQQLESANKLYLHHGRHESLSWVRSIDRKETVFHVVLLVHDHTDNRLCAHHANVGCTIQPKTSHTCNKTNKIIIESTRSKRSAPPPILAEFPRPPGRIRLLAASRIGRSSSARGRRRCFVTCTCRGRLQCFLCHD